MKFWILFVLVGVVLAIAIKFSGKMMSSSAVSNPSWEDPRVFSLIFRRIAQPRVKSSEIGCLPSTGSSLEDQRVSVIGILEKNPQISDPEIDDRYRPTCVNIVNTPLATDNQAFAPRSHEESGKKSQVTLWPVYDVDKSALKSLELPRRDLHTVNLLIVRSSTD